MPTVRSKGGAVHGSTKGAMPFNRFTAAAIELVEPLRQIDYSLLIAASENSASAATSGDDDGPANR